MSDILVFAEQREGEIKKIAFENLTVAKKLATEMGSQVTAVLVGNSVAGLAAELGKYGAEKVKVYQNASLEHYSSEGYAKVMADAIQDTNASVVIFGATAMGKDLAPRVAAKVNGAVATDVIAVEADGNDLKIVRPVYAGKVRTTIKLTAAVKILTIRPNVFLPEENPASGSVEEKAAEVSDFKESSPSISSGNFKPVAEVSESNLRFPLML